MALILLKFFLCAGIILFCGKRVAKYGDVVALLSVFLVGTCINFTPGNV